MNFVHIAGHLGADPETRFTQTGRKVTTVRLAARTRKSGNDETIWWRVTIWGDQFDRMLSYLKKGSPLIVVGEMQKPEIFSDREGHPQISMEVTAFQLHFSPFGKPNATPGQGGEASPLSAGSPYHGAPPFGALPEMSPQAPVASGIAPVGSGGASLSSGGTSHSAGETFDDEVPF